MRASATPATAPPLAPLGVLAILLAALLLVHLWLLPVGYDESNYLCIADRIAATGLPCRGDTFHPAPFLNNPPLVFAVASLPRQVSPGYLLPRVMHLVVLVLPLLVGLAALGRRLHPERGALASLLLLGATAPVMEHAVQVRLDVPVATCFVLSLCSLSSYLEAPARSPAARLHLVLLCLCTTLGALTSYQAVLVPAALALTLLVTPGARRLTPLVAMVLGGVGGVLLWMLLLGAMGSSLGDALAGNVEQGRFALPGADTLAPLTREAVALPLFLAAPLLLVWGRPHGTPPAAAVTSRVILRASALFALGTLLLTAVTVPPHARYLLKAQPALALLVVPGLAGHLRGRGAWLAVGALAAMALVGLWLPVSGAVRRAGIALGLLAVVLLLAAIHWRRLGLAALVCLLAALTLAPYRLAPDRTIDTITSRELRDSLEAGAWVREHLPVATGPLATLRRPTQAFCGRPAAVLTRGGASLEESLTTLDAAAHVVVTTAGWETLLQLRPALAGTLEARLTATFEVSHQGSGFQVYQRR